jgi:carboxyl-terminal processing protease
LNALIASAKEDDYFERISSSIQELKKTIENEKKRDLLYFKKEIKEFLESEIAFHYFYQKGRVEQSWENDPTLQKGISMFNQMEEYQKIIQP